MFSISKCTKSATDHESTLTQKRTVVPTRGSGAPFSRPSSKAGCAHRIDELRFIVYRIKVCGDDPTALQMAASSICYQMIHCRKSAVLHHPELIPQRHNLILGFSSQLQVILTKLFVSRILTAGLGLKIRVITGVLFSHG